MENTHASLLPDVSCTRQLLAWIVPAANTFPEAGLQVVDATRTSSNDAGTKVAVAPSALVASRTMSAGQEMTGGTVSAAQMRYWYDISYQLQYWFLA